MLHKRIRGLGLPHTDTISFYETDVSGSKEYRFNSLGFRGDELSDSAKRLFFACGCSITFGVGLNEDEIWVHDFQSRYSHRYGYRLEDINLLNFSETGASNEAIVRTLLPQCEALKPDLLLIQFTYANRTEYLWERLALSVGPWFLGRNEADPEWLAQWREIVEHYYSYYSDEIGFASTVRSILLLQCYCEKNCIPYVFWWVADPKSEMSRLADNKVCAQLYDLINWDRFCSVHPEILNLDKAADNRHAGPAAHRIVGERLFAFSVSTLDSIEQAQPPTRSGLRGLFHQRTKNKLQRLRAEEPNTYTFY